MLKIQRSEKMIFDILFSEKQILEELLCEKEGCSLEDAEKQAVQMIMHVTFRALTKVIQTK